MSILIRKIFFQVGGVEVSTNDPRSEFERRLEEDRKRIKAQQEARAREEAARKAAELAEKQRKAQEALEMLRAQAKEQEAKGPVLPTEHVVQSGDTLSGIAKKYYGDAAKWPEIYKANKDVIGDDPSKIYPGQKFTIPKLD